MKTGDAPLRGCAAVRYAHLRSTAQRSLSPESVTHVVIVKCHPCGESVPDTRPTPKEFSFAQRGFNFRLRAQ